MLQLTEEQKINLEWILMVRACYPTQWSLGVLQPEYVYFQQPLVIVDDSE